MPFMTLISIPDLVVCLEGLSSTRFFLSVFPAAFLTQTVVVDDTTVKFEIWDTAGK